MIDLPTLDALLPAYLARQPWFAHGEARNRSSEGESVDVGAVVREREIWRDGNPGLIWAILDTTLDGVDVGSYQVLIGLRPAVPSPAFLAGADSRVLGTLLEGTGEWIAYDALVDPELTIAALESMFEGLRGVRSVRKLTAGKTSTSVVADEHWLCKVFRRIHDGANPGVDMPARLGEEGFRATLETVEAWRSDGVDLALRRPFLPGAANGLDLAAASLRELFASRLDPQASPGDFSSEARRVGTMLADMHRASEAAYGVMTQDRDELLAEVAQQVVDLAIDGLGRERVEDWVRRCRGALDKSIPTIRVHGNLHLGQLLRSDQGWLILDFEGAPLLPTAERRVPRPGWFDVGSMLRSLDYVAEMTRAARVAPRPDGSLVADEARKWVERNSDALFEGYRRARDSDGEVGALVAVGEVARAAYEVSYERANRREFEYIPTAALRRLVVP